MENNFSRDVILEPVAKGDLGLNKVFETTVEASSDYIGQKRNDPGGFTSGEISNGSLKVEVVDPQED